MPSEGGEPLAVWTDEALFEQTRVRVAFTERAGGVSTGAFSSLNIGQRVQDDPAAVRANLARIGDALALGSSALVQPKQVHGDRVLQLKKATAQLVEEFRTQAERGADALVIQPKGVAAVLAFADCVPLVMVGPSGHFAVVHAGWRGVDAGIAVAALRKLVLCEPGLSTDASCINVYRGAYIHAECFEVGEDVHQLFVDRYGSAVAPDSTHIDLGKALDIDLVRAGVNPERIAEVGECTVCNHDRWFSYRASKGECGRHAALCVALG